MANRLHPGTAPDNHYYQSLQQDYSTNRYYGTANPNPADAPEVVPTNLPPHSRGDNQPQMMGMDWQEKVKPAMQTYYDPKIGTYPESIPVQPYQYKFDTPTANAPPTQSYRTEVDGTPLEAVPGQQFNPQPTTAIYGDKGDPHRVQAVHEMGGFPYQGAGDDSNRGLAEPTKKGNKILGLPVAVAWALLALIVIGAVGLGVGLGVGLSQRASNDSAASSPAAAAATSTGRANPENQQPAPTRTVSPAQGSGSTTSSSTTSATQSVVTSGTRGISGNSCNFDGTREYRSGSERFEALCTVDWPQGADAANGVGKVVDLSKSVAYTFEDCIGECVKYNDKAPAARCVAVTYNSNLTQFFPMFGANCFLKDRRGVNTPQSDTSACAAML